MILILHSNLVDVLMQLLFISLNSLLRVVLDRYLIVVVSIVEVIKDVVTHSKTNSIVIIAVEQERVLIVHVWVGILQKVSNSRTKFGLSLVVLIFQSPFFPFSR